MIDTISVGPRTFILIGSHTNFAIFIMTHPQLKKTWSTYTLWMVGWDQRTLQVAVQKMLPHHVCQSSVVTMVTCLLVTLLIQMQNSTYSEILLPHTRYKLYIRRTISIIHSSWKFESGCCNFISTSAFLNLGPYFSFIFYFLFCLPSMTSFFLRL